MSEDSQSYCDCYYLGARGRNLVEELKLKGIIFDLDGTLYQSPQYERHFTELYTALLSSKLRVSETEAITALREAKRKHHSLTLSLEMMGIPRREFHDYMEKNLQIERFIAPSHRVSQLMSFLRGQGLRLGILTNASRPITLRLIAQLGLNIEQFDAICTSSEVEAKPSLEPFRIIAETIGLNPSDMLYVGDRLYAEIRPAHKAGYKTVFLTEGRSRRIGEPSVDHIIHSIFDLLDILPKESKLS